MEQIVRREIADRLAEYGSLLEVGIGRRPEVAAALATAGCDVTAIDVDPERIAEVKAGASGTGGHATDPGEHATDAGEHDADGLTVRVDDVTDVADRAPIDPEYRVDAVYGLNLPAELQRPTRRLARRVGADCLFTTLGFEEPVVPVERHRLDREVLYVDRR